MPIRPVIGLRGSLGLRARLVGPRDGRVLPNFVQETDFLQELRSFYVLC
jgi:hypothetical protein